MAIAYQNVDRWADASATLLAVRMPMGRHWIESATDELTRLSRRDEIAYVMAWLRDAVHLYTPRIWLAQQIDAMIANPKVTHREKVALQIWQSYTAHQRRDNTAARDADTTTDRQWHGQQKHRQYAQCRRGHRQVSRG